jgi:hypothetical protein
MDRLGRATSGGQHVRSNCYLRRLRHKPEHRAPSGDHPNCSIGCGATLARPGWAVNKNSFARSTLATCCIGNLALYFSQANLGRIAHNK